MATMILSMFIVIICNVVIYLYDSAVNKMNSYSINDGLEKTPRIIKASAVSLLCGTLGRYLVNLPARVRSNYEQRHGLSSSTELVPLSPIATQRLQSMRLGYNRLRPVANYAIGTLNISSSDFYPTNPFPMFGDQITRDLSTDGVVWNKNLVVALESVSDAESFSIGAWAGASYIGLMMLGVPLAQGPVAAHALVFSVNALVEFTINRVTGMIERHLSGVPLEENIYITTIETDNIIKSYDVNQASKAIKSVGTFVRNQTEPVIKTAVATGRIGWNYLELFGNMMDYLSNLNPLEMTVIIAFATIMLALLSKMFNGLSRRIDRTFGGDDDAMRRQINALYEQRYERPSYRAISASEREDEQRRRRMFDSGEIPYNPRSSVTTSRTSPRTQELLANANLVLERSRNLTQPRP